MFRIGRAYTRPQIHSLVGGSLRSYLPHVRGQVVAACLRLDTNPAAPAVILPGRGPGIEAAADLLISQTTSVPTFLKRAPCAWEYVGEFLPARWSRDPAEIKLNAQRSGRSDISMVIHMKRAS